MNKKIGDRLRLLREENDYSQQQVADKVKISDSSYQNYEYGKRDIPGDVLKRFAALYGVTVDFLLCLSPYRNGAKVVSDDSLFVEIPLYGAIAAGTPIEMIEVDGTHPIPKKMVDQYPESFLLEVKGESMNRILPSGCYALIEPCADIERDNQPYAVCVNGYDATVKRVKKLANGFELVPDSTDPTYKPKVYDYGEEGTEQITVIGRVVYHVIPFDWTY